MTSVLIKFQNPCCDSRTLSILPTCSNVLAEFLIMIVGSLTKTPFIIPDINVFLPFHFNRLARGLIFTLFLKKQSVAFLILFCYVYFSELLCFGFYPYIFASTFWWLIFLFFFKHLEIDF